MKAPHSPPAGATPLDPDELAGLIPSHVSTQGERNEVEQANLVKALSWAERKHAAVLSDEFLRRLHQRMFGEVWRWAGTYRKTGKNIGVPAHEIAPALRVLCADTGYWIEHQVYPWIELGARFHHRLACIHAFPNGNGRHARLMTDILLRQHGEVTFTWGALAWAAGERQDEAVRKTYLDALRTADRGDLEPLCLFVCR